MAPPMAPIHQPAPTKTSSCRHSVAQPISEDEQKWRDEQMRFWESQLSLARKLNWITFFCWCSRHCGLINSLLYFEATQELPRLSKDQAGAAKIATEIAKQTFDEKM